MSHSFLYHSYLRTILSLVCIFSTVALNSCGGGGGGGQGTVTISPVVNSPAPGDIFVRSSQGILIPSLRDNAGLSVESESTTNGRAMRQINFDTRLGLAGQGVTVAIADGRVDQGANFLDRARTRIAYTAPRRVGDEPNSHGTTVAGIVGGRIGSVVYGLAHRAHLDSFAIDEINPLRPGPPRIFASEFYNDLPSIVSSARVVNLSFGPTFNIGFDSENDVMFGGFLFSSGDSFILTIPENPARNPGPAFNNFQGFFVAGGRLGVWAAGNDGFGRDGRVSVIRNNLLGLEADIPVADFRRIFGDGPGQMLDDMLYSIRPAQYRWAQVSGHPEREGYFLVATSIDPNFVRGSSDVRTARLADYSNACGIVKDYCLVAPGETDGPFGRRRGTSFAAPYVSGAAAALMSTYPDLSVPTVSEILLTTATDLGEPGVDDEFGHGLLDFTNAMSPQGSMTSSTGFQLTQTNIQLSPALAGAMMTSDATFGMFDKYQRPYLHSVVGRLNPDKGMQRVSQAAAAATADAELDKITLALRDDGQDILQQFNKRQRLSFHLEQCLYACAVHGQTAPGGLLSIATLARSSARIGDHTAVVAEMGSNANGAPAYHLGALRTGHSFNALNLGLEAGYLAEQDTFLGSSFHGALGVSEANSRYVNAQLHVQLPGQLLLRGSATRGVAHAAPAHGSYVTQVTATKFDALRLGLGGLLNGANGGWELFATRPLAATSGELQIKSVGGYRSGDNEWSIVSDQGQVGIIGTGSTDGTGQLREDVTAVNFSNGRRPSTLGLAWRQLLSSNIEISSQFEYVLNSPQRSYQGQEARMLVQLEFNY